MAHGNERAAEETIGGIRTVRAFTQEETEASRYRAAVDATSDDTLERSLRGFVDAVHTPPPTRR